MGLASQGSVFQQQVSLTGWSLEGAVSHSETILTSMIATFLLLSHNTTCGILSVYSAVYVFWQLVEYRLSYTMLLTATVSSL